MSGEIDFVRSGLLPESDDVRITVARLNQMITGLNARLAANSVSERELADDAIGPGKLAPEAVGYEHLASGAVGRRNVRPGTVGRNELAQGAVETGAIADGAVSEQKLAFNPFAKWEHGYSFTQQSITATNVFTDVAGLSVTISPSTAESRVLLHAVVHLTLESSEGDPFVLVRFERNGNPVTFTVQANAYYHGTDSVSIPVLFVDQPGSADPQIYKVQVYLPYLLGIKAEINKLAGAAGTATCCWFVAQVLL